jgi:PncC family amidohydrolase
LDNAAGTSPERQLRDMLLAHPDMTIGTAESCTGGSIAARLTSIDGSSAYVLGGIVAYANEIKHRLLGVPESVLANPGAVSAECAAAMAEGAKRSLGTLFAVSSTGIAGPTGGTARKPVGLVYLAQSGPAGTTVEEHIFPGDRLAITQSATQRALELLLAAVTTYISSSSPGHQTTGQENPLP